MCTCSNFCDGCFFERLERDAETHPLRGNCDVIDCCVCGFRDCAFNDFMHYCGESCTSCGFIETYARPDTTQWTGFGHTKEREQAVVKEPLVDAKIPTTETSGKKMSST